MRTILITLTFTILFTLTLNKLHAQEIQAQTLYLSELYPNPEGSDSGKEWVELFNNAEDSIVVSGLQIVTVSASGAQRHTTIPQITIEPKSYFLILENNNIAPDFLAKVVVGDGALNLYNDGQFIRLLDPSGNTLDELTYSTTVSGKSWERNGILSIEGCNLLNQHTSSNTIGTQNSNYLNTCWEQNLPDPEPEPEPDPEPVPPAILELNEYNFENNTFLVELYNPNDFDVDISIYQISGIQISESSCGNVISARNYCLITLPQVLSELTLQAQNLQMETVISDNAKASKYLDNWYSDFESSLGFKNVPPSTLLISEVYPSPNSSETEWLEIFNYGNFPLNLKDFYFKERSSSGGYSSTQSFLPDLVIQPGQYLAINDSELKISLNNSGDKIALFDSLNNITDELEYPAIDKGISYSKSENGFELSQKFTPNQANEIVFIEQVIPPKKQSSSSTSSVKKVTTVKPKTISKSTNKPTTKSVLGQQSVNYKLPSLTKNSINSDITYQTKIINIWPIQLLATLILLISFVILNKEFKHNLINTINKIRNFFKTIERLETKAVHANSQFQNSQRYDIFA